MNELGETLLLHSEYKGCKSMAVQIERMAMVLTAMRGDFALSREAGNELKPELNSDSMNETLLCSDIDYETAEIIGSKMLMHMAMAYRMIKGDEAETMPEIKPIDQRTILLDALPDEYESKRLYSEAQSQGICVRTATRWNDYWQEHGFVQKIRHGYYKKVA